MGKRTDGGAEGEPKRDDENKGAKERKEGKEKQRSKRIIGLSAAHRVSLSLPVDPGA